MKDYATKTTRTWKGRRTRWRSRAEKGPGRRRQVHAPKPTPAHTGESALARVLVHELETFTVQITDAGNETFGAENERAHDDLVLATSLALWAAENIDVAD